MTVTFFQSAGHLHRVLTQALAGLTPQASASALDDLRRLPAFRDLSSLLQLTEPRRLTGLLFDLDRYDAVTGRLGVAPEARRDVFGRENRASRILPEFCTLSSQPRLWLDAGLRKETSETFEAAAGAVIDDWRDAKVRRIAPRGREPIGFWTAQRTLVIGPARLIAEFTALIQEDATEFERYVAHARLKLMDWKGTLLPRDRVEEMAQNPFLAARSGRAGSLESRFEGIVPGTDHPWQIWSVPRNLAINIASPILQRRQRKEIGEFFRIADAKFQDILGFILAH